MVKVGTRQFSVLLLLFGTGPEIELLTQLPKHLGRLVQCFDHPSELAQDIIVYSVSTANFGGANPNPSSSE